MCNTALGDNIDFDSTTQTVTIVHGTNSSTVNITVTYDDEPEGDEMFNISLVVPSSVDSRIVTGNRTSALAVITDASSKCYVYGIISHIITVIATCVCVVFAPVCVCVCVLVFPCQKTDHIRNYTCTLSSILINTILKYSITQLNCHLHI